jgi:hypothetical protein
LLLVAVLKLALAATYHLLRPVPPPAIERSALCFSYSPDKAQGHP